VRICHSSLDLELRRANRWLLGNRPAGSSALLDMALHFTMPRGSINCTSYSRCVAVGQQIVSVHPQLRGEHCSASSFNSTARFVASSLSVCRVLPPPPQVRAVKPTPTSH
jgi:hypothetical protein